MEWKTKITNQLQEVVNVLDNRWTKKAIITSLLWLFTKKIQSKNMLSKIGLKVKHDTPPPNSK